MIEVGAVHNICVIHAVGVMNHYIGILVNEFVLYNLLKKEMLKQ